MADSAGDLQALFAEARTLRDVHLETATHPDGTEALVVLAREAEDGLPMAVAVKESVFDGFRTAPRLATGDHVLATVESFIEVVNRFATARAAVFADRGDARTGAGANLCAVFDWHGEPTAWSEATRDYQSVATPGGRRHKAHFRFPLSPEWQDWLAHDGVDNAMGQAQFAAFIEDRIMDIGASHDAVNADIDGPESHVAQVCARLGTHCADPARLMELSRGLDVRVDQQVRAAHRTQSGEGHIVFETAHKDGSGGELVVPGVFVVEIPIVEDGARYRIPARLRYRIVSGSLMWWYDLYRPDLQLADLFRDMVETVRAGVGEVPVYLGRSNSV